MSGCQGLGAERKVEQGEAPQVTFRSEMPHEVSWRRIRILSVYASEPHAADANLLDPDSSLAKGGPPSYLVKQCIYWGLPYALPCFLFPLTGAWVTILRRLYTYNRAAHISHYRVDDRIRTRVVRERSSTWGSGSGRVVWVSQKCFGIH